MTIFFLGESVLWRLIWGLEMGFGGLIMVAFAVAIDLKSVFCIDRSEYCSIELIWLVFGVFSRPKILFSRRLLKRSLLDMKNVTLQRKYNLQVTKEIIVLFPSSQFNLILVLFSSYVSHQFSSCSLLPFSLSWIALEDTAHFVLLELITHDYCFCACLLWCACYIVHSNFAC